MYDAIREGADTCSANKSPGSGGVTGLRMEIVRGEVLSPSSNVVLRKDSVILRPTIFLVPRSTSPSRLQGHPPVFSSLSIREAIPPLSRTHPDAPPGLLL